MCGRYYLGEKTAYEIQRELEMEDKSLNIRPGDVTPASTPIVLSAKKDGDKRMIQIGTMFWGIDGKDNKLIINARAESVLTKPMFSASFEHRRCVMPADSFYEWDRQKNKVTFYRKDRAPIYLAGIYQLSKNQDSFAILTTEANASMIKVHDRMPLMIEREKVSEWLYDYEAAKSMIDAEMPLLESSQEYEQLSLF